MTKVETPTPVDLFRLLGEFEAPLAQQVIICPDEDGLLLLMVMSGLLPGAKPDPDSEPEVVAARWGTVEDLDNFIKILEQHRDRVFGPVFYGPRPALRPLAPAAYVPRSPFSYTDEPYEGARSFRIADADDNRIATCFDEGNARWLVARLNVDEGTAEKPAGLDSEFVIRDKLDAARGICLHCRDTGRVRDHDSDIGWVACPFCGPPPAGNAA